MWDALWSIAFGKLGLDTKTCSYSPQVNVGCVPKKVMWNTAVHAEFIHDHADYGFETPSVKFNWRTIKEKRDAYVRRLNDIYENNVKKVSMECVYPAIRVAKVMDFWPLFQP
ncbi:hypothetical protein Nmel_006582 [Mimus melanotis]